MIDKYWFYLAISIQIIASILFMLIVVRDLGKEPINIIEPLSSTGFITRTAQKESMNGSLSIAYPNSEEKLNVTFRGIPFNVSYGEVICVNDVCVMIGREQPK